MNRKIFIRWFFIVSINLVFANMLLAQNVGIGTTTPQGKLHIKGNADTSQLVITANATQSHTQPLIRIRNAAGIDLMHIHTDDSTNIFIGKNAGKANTSTALDGNENVFIGLSAGSANTNGFQNVAIGSSALKNNTTGYECVAVGRSSLSHNTDGIVNTAVGTFSLFLNTSGSYNTAVGENSLYANTTALDNTAVGYNSLSVNNGSSNTAIGSEALSSNSLGSDNTAIGNRSLYNNNGLRNTGVGRLSLSTNASGQNNSALGFQADNASSSLSNNTMIGAYSKIINASGCTAIGYNSSTMNTNNLIVLGTPSTALTGGYTAWTNFSDGRFKKNIAEDVKGLSFIMRLRPVTYYMDVRGLYNFWQLSPYGSDEESRNTKTVAFIDESIQKKESIRMSGFIAQEVEKAANETGYDFDGVIKPQHDKDHYRLAYAEFVVPLVKAVQEQQAVITELKNENTVLQKQMDEQRKFNANLEQQIAELKALIKKQ